MKKQILKCLFLSLFSFLFAHEVNHSFSIDVFGDVKSSPDSFMGVSCEYDLFFDELNLTSGFQYFDKLYSFSVDAGNKNLYRKAFEKSQIGFGVNGGINVLAYAEACELNLFALTGALYETSSHFSFTGEVGFLFKNSFIFPDTKDTFWFYEFTPLVTLKVLKQFSFGLDLMFSFSTFTFYEYPLFCTPFYTFEAGYNITEKHRIALFCRLRIADQFTTAPYLSRGMLGVSWRYFL